MLKFSEKAKKSFKIFHETFFHNMCTSFIELHIKYHEEICTTKWYFTELKI